MRFANNRFMGNFLGGARQPLYGKFNQGQFMFRQAKPQNAAEPKPPVHKQGLLIPAISRLDKQQAYTDQLINTALKLA